MEASAESQKPRLLVFVIAYQAEATLASVSSRIPQAVFADHACEVLVVDDASQDNTAAIGREFRARNPALPLTVLRNQFNQIWGLNAWRRLVELPIPTYDGDEISRVNGLRDAKAVPLARLRNAFHRAGL